MSFLGYIIEQSNLKPDPAEIRVIRVVEWPEPADRCKLRKFLAFANFYRRFIGDFSKIALPLTRLTSLFSLFSVGLGCSKGLHTAQGTIHHCTHLAQPDLRLQFIVEVDASDSGVGGLFQPFSLAASPLQNATLMWETGSSWL